VIAVSLSVEAHSAPVRLIPTRDAAAPSAAGGRGDFDYDPTSAYDQKGLSVPRGFTAQAPAELIDPFSGNLVPGSPAST
jgi:hypothetical protein